MSQSSLPSPQLTQEQRIQLAIDFLNSNPACSQRQAAKKRYWALDGKVGLARRAWRDGISKIDLYIFTSE
jgi:hypothetical protein